jgi:hypothetical protein
MDTPLQKSSLSKAPKEKQPGMRASQAIVNQKRFCTNCPPSKRFNNPKKFTTMKTTHPAPTFWPFIKKHCNLNLAYLE